MNDRDLNIKYVALSFLVLTVFWFSASTACHAYDSWCFSEWGKCIFKNGMGKVYDSGSDYLPLFHYLLTIYVSLQDTIDQVGANIHYMKVFSVIFLLVNGYFMICFFRLAGTLRENHIYNVLFFLLNLAVLYNSIIWNQVDIILGAFVFMSAYFAIRQKTLPALVMLLLGLNFKVHAVIFIPVIGLVVLPQVVRSVKSGKILLYLIVLAAVQLLILLPFIVAGTVKEVSGVALAAVDKFPFVSNFAYNAWYLLVRGDVHVMKDTALFLGLSYKNWGLILFFVTSGAALIPLMKQCYSNLKRKALQVSLDKVLIIFALIPLLFFYFNTQMHERYAHPALAFLITYCVIKREAVLGFICCLAYLLNLEDELRYLELKNYGTVLFDPVFISLLYLTSITWLFVLLFRKVPSERRGMTSGDLPN